MATRKATVTRPSSETPFSIRPNEPRQSSTHTMTMTGSAHHCRATPVASCSAMHTPPSSAPSVRRLTSATVSSGTTKKLKPNRSRMALAMV